MGGMSSKEMKDRQKYHEYTQPGGQDHLGWWKRAQKVKAGESEDQYAKRQKRRRGVAAATAATGSVAG